ncbi:hypothetical protein B0H13DRAFT_2350399 [Mycena leptocephala]|nr:hypothetical protein B0H13DRAFT_2350399 [Mycena leptocephala]
MAFSSLFSTTTQLNRKSTKYRSSTFYHSALEVREMHPSLHPDNISKLPVSSQPGATAALGGSMEHLQSLLDMLANEKECDMYMPTLPVFYANLDPASIPDEQSDLSTTSSTKALLSLNALRLFSLFNSPIPAGEDLWPRVWLWTRFLHNNHHSLPGQPLELDICTNFLFIIWNIGRHPPTFQLVSETPGVRAILVRAWKLLFARQRPNNISLSALFWVQRELLKTADPANFAEVIEGAGGNVGDWATLFVQYIDSFIPSNRTEVTPRILLYMDALFCVLYGDQDVPLEDVGGVTSLTRLACAFGASRIPQTDDILGACLFRLLPLLRKGSLELYRTAREMLSAGFLRAITICGISKAETALLTDIFIPQLAQSTVYYSVVSQFESAVFEAEDLLADPTFSTSEIFGPWKLFRSLAEERVLLWKFWSSAAYVSQKACDNMDCGHIGKKADFKTCTCCHTVFYCSRRCQCLDWEQDHRAQCSFNRFYGLKYRDPLSSRNISFLRAVLHHDYEAHKETVLRRQLTFMRDHPSESIVTIFDYASGVARISVEPIYPASSLMPNYLGVNCLEHVPRALRSRGRMQLHLVALPDRSGLISKSRMFPMRSNNSLLYDGVCSLATKKLKCRIFA